VTIGDKIRIQRKALGLTQTELGEKLGVKTNAVSKWECGRVEDIPMSKVKAMAVLFNVRPSYLIDDECPIAEGKKPTPVSESGLSEDAQVVARAYEKATPKDQQTVRFVLSDYLQDVAEPKVLAARTSGEPIKDDPSTFIIEGEDPDLP